MGTNTVAAICSLILKPSLMNGLAVWGFAVAFALARDFVAMGVML